MGSVVGDAIPCVLEGFDFWEVVNNMQKFTELGSRKPGGQCKITWIFFLIIFYLSSLGQLHYSGCTVFICCRKKYSSLSPVTRGGESPGLIQKLQWAASPQYDLRASRNPFALKYHTHPRPAGSKIIYHWRFYSFWLNIALSRQGILKCK